MLPFKTINELEEFDKRLADVETFRQTTMYMKNIGGPNQMEHVQKILQKFLSDEVAFHYNVGGKLLKKTDSRKRKRSFKNTKLFDCIIAGTKAEHTIVENRLKFKIGKWLAGANLRLILQRKRRAREIL
ncbi:unnamed protein product [Brassicogethes aeneus]|uniref:DUF4806 domain-containing protein n=1 Tax=Brassicogethes aeneus TaxID=1431903 RepID=A0A9P0AR52_BRAAE|nr:unnamed protein product [Brassicogethes aeneus]